jgi:hypothetical protein
MLHGTAGVHKNRRKSTKNGHRPGGRGHCETSRTDKTMRGRSPANEQSPQQTTRGITDQHDDTRGEAPGERREPLQVASHRTTTTPPLTSTVHGGISLPGGPLAETLAQQGTKHDARIPRNMTKSREAPRRRALNMGPTPAQPMSCPASGYRRRGLTIWAATCADWIASPVPPVAPPKISVNV